MLFPAFIVTQGQKVRYQIAINSQTIRREREVLKEFQQEQEAKVAL
jgi:hypothetical protein